MGSSFDPYHEWLGIPPEEQPANHYRLLGIKAFENTPNVIEHAADQRMGHLRTFQAGKHGPLSQRLLNEVAAAKLCLLHAEKKTAYDARLREAIQSQPGPAETSDERFAAQMADVLAAAKSSTPGVGGAAGSRRTMPVVAGLGVGGAVVVVLILVGTGVFSSTKTPEAKPVQQVAVKVAPPAIAQKSDVANRLAAGLAPRGATPAVHDVTSPAVDKKRNAEKTKTEQETPKPVAVVPAPAFKPEPAAKPAVAPAPPAASEFRTPNSELKRSPVPDDAALGPAVKLAGEVFKEEYDKAQSPGELQALAKRILQRAGEIQDDAAARFVFLRLARDVATKAADHATAYAAVEQMAERFEMDPWAMKAGVVAAVAKQARDKSEHKTAAQQALTLMRDALRQDALSTAEQMGKLALAEGSRVRDRDTIAAARAAIKETEQAAKAFSKVEVALNTLKEKPDDAGANLVAGQYQCFTKGAWSKGLPMLAKGADETLKALAQRDAKADATSEPPTADQLSLADAWWDLAQQAGSKEKEGMLLRAGYWYQRAAGEVDSDALRLKIEKRLAGITKLGRPIPEPPPGTARRVLTNSIGMKLVLIPAGEFMMGSTAEEIAWAVEKGKGDGSQPNDCLGETPRHPVKISQPFYMSMYPVTQGEYQEVMGVNPSSFSAKGQDGGRVTGRDTSRHPVEMVSWEEAAEFCRRMSAHPKERATRRMYRLPTEAEWEYACRAGTTTHWVCGNDRDALVDYAWVKKNSDRMTHPVGKKKPNAWGLYDMNGNVWEWCLDWYSVDYYKQSPAANPTGPPQGVQRVLRGGCFYTDDPACRSAYRHKNLPKNRDRHAGFRVVVAP
jgi:formylglycine-generating enzyme required for sulfatase activity